jgi:tRNA pseudouridine55 synthase
MLPKTEGIICINKPQGMTSFDVVAVIRGLLHEKRVGHAGTLDPMATGVLPVFVGRATKVIDLLPIRQKRYTAAFRLGIRTDTGDITGNIIDETAVKPGIGDVGSALEQFKGDTEQIPPMYSALKQNGVRLYELARQGIEVERKARKISVFEINLIGSNEVENEYTIDVLCSKGTYIRSICEDIGNSLGCGATMTSLCRTMSSGYTLEKCISIEEARQYSQENSLKYINALSEKTEIVESAFTILPEVFVTKNQATRFLNGGALLMSRLDHCPADGMCRVKTEPGIFLGLAIVDTPSQQLKSKYIHFDSDFYPLPSGEASL